MIDLTDQRTKAVALIDVSAIVALVCHNPDRDGQPVKLTLYLKGGQNLELVLDLEDERDLDRALKEKLAESA